MAASVRVDNVSPDATETLLRQHFAFHGTISRVAIVGCALTQRARAALATSEGGRVGKEGCRRWFSVGSSAGIGHA
eukprot:6183304-Pleurochrysis_carterae.AAC.1